MPDLSQLMGLVRWEVVAGMAALPIVLQLVGAIIHPAVFNIVTLLTICGLFVVGVLDGLNAPDPVAYQAQVLEMAIVGLIVMITHIFIRKLFMAMARASRVA